MRTKKLFCPLIISLAALSLCESALAEKALAKGINDAYKTTSPFYQNVNIVVASLKGNAISNSNNNVTIIINGIKLDHNLYII